MFIIAIKTGQSIPERLFGEESSHGAGARRSVADRRQDRAGGRWMFLFCPGRMLLLSSRTGSRTQPAPSAAREARSSAGPGLVLVGARVGSLRVWGRLGWVDGWTGVPDLYEILHPQGSLECRKDPG